MVWGATVRERLLTQHFLQRFLENDLLSPTPITTTPSPWSAAAC